MTFCGWPAEAIEFFEGLEADNSRSYWHAHRAIYDDVVRAPMVALLAGLEPEFGPGKIFRPNRDTRFSADKSLYKTNIAATLERGGYVSFSADGLGVGAGLYMPDAQQLARFREAVADNKTGTKLVKLVDAARKAGLEVTAHDELKTAPKGFPKDHPRIELLRYKGLITWKQWPVAAWMGTRKAQDRIAQVWRDAKPITDWLLANVVD